MDTRARTMREKQLDADLKQHNFSDKAATDKLAMDRLGELHIKSEQFKALYDKRKPPEVPAWTHQRTLETLSDSIAENSRADNHSTIKRLRAESDRIRTELIKPVEEELENRAATVNPQSGNDETAKKPVEIDGIENLGAITESRITGTDLDKRFTIKNDRYYLKDTNKEAFRDTGKKIIVKAESRKVVAEDVVKLADSKGWTNIKVTGNDEFKREVWKEAHTRGIDVQGYTPTEQDKRDLDSQLNAIEAAPRADKPKAVNQTIAPEKTESIGDTKSENPEVIRRQSLVESFKKDTPTEAVKKHPELKDMYTLQMAAINFGIEAIRVTADRHKFVAAVVDRGMDELAKGNLLPEFQKARTPDRSAEVER